MSVFARVSSGFVRLFCRGPEIGPDATVAVPDAPSDLTATWNTGVGGRVDLAWTDNSDDETGFKVYKNTVDTFSSATLVTTTAEDATSYAVTGLTNDTLHYFWVVATNAGGDSDPTSSASATPRIHPSDISGLSILLESANTMTGTTNCSQWNDASSNSLNVAQGTGAAQPTINATDATINDARSLTGDGGDYMTVASNDVLKPGTGDFALLALAKWSGNADKVIFGRDSFSGGGHSGYFLKFGTDRLQFVTRNSGVSNNTLSASTTVDTAWHMCVGRRLSNVLDMKVDNADKGSAAEAGAGADVDAQAASTAFKVMTADESLNQKWDGKLAAVIMYKGTITDGNLTNLYNRWQALYAW